jgi:hypothetical protein
MGYFSELDYEQSQENEPTQWEIEDTRADAEYDIKKDKCAHLPKDIWNKVSSMPTSQAVMYGEELTKIANQVVFNRDIVESIWGKDFDKSSEFFDVK